MISLRDAELELHLINIEDKLEALQDMINNSPEQWTGYHYEEWTRLSFEYYDALEESQS